MRRWYLALLPMALSCGHPGASFTSGENDASSTVVANDAEPTASACPNAQSSISGHAYAPNGVDPIPGILVSIVPNTQVFPAAPSTVQCQVCASTSAQGQSVSSSADGSFSIVGGQLNAGGTFTVVFESGGFRHVQRNVTVPACGQVTLTAEQSKLPGASSGDDTIPRIAVAGAPANGSRSTSSSATVNDDFEHVLNVIGITGYDTVDPDKSGSSSGAQTQDLIGLLSDMTQLSQYQLVIAPCGSLGNFSVAQNITPTMASNVRAWLGMGGRLYASDLAYSLIDQTYNGAITFAAGPSSHANADPADVGVGLGTASLPGTITDPSLLAWLQGLGVLASGVNTIPIVDLKDPWGAMDSVPDAELTGSSGPSGAVLVNGSVSWHTGQSGVHPLTAMADYAAPGGNSCGRVVFTSYHVESSTSNTLSPQERVLEFLFFRLSTCIDIPG